MEERMRKPAKCLSFGLVVWAMVITLLRAARLPNDFAEAHWLIDYRHGFIKRGFIGTFTTILSRCGIASQTESAIAAFSFFTLVLFCLILLYASLRILSTLRWDIASFLLILVFTTSPYMVMSAHLVGYFDNILVVLSFTSALLALRNHSWPAAGLAALAVLIHESFILVGFPLILLAIYLQAVRLSNGKFSLRQFVPFALPIFAFLCLVISRTFFINREHLRRMLWMHLTTFDFIQNGRNTRVPIWLTKPFLEYLEAEGPQFLDRITDPYLILAIIPSVLVILCFTVCHFRIRPISIQFSSIVVVTFAPFLMLAVAFDTSRIWTYPLLCAFGCAWLHCEAFPPNNRCNRSSLLILLAIPTLVLNAFVRIPLMDGEIERFTIFERALLHAPLLLGTISLLLTSSRHARNHSINDAQSEGTLDS